MYKCIWNEKVYRPAIPIVSYTLYSICCIEFPWNLDRFHFSHTKSCRNILTYKYSLIDRQGFYYTTISKMMIFKEAIRNSEKTFTREIYKRSTKKIFESSRFNSITP